MAPTALDLTFGIELEFICVHPPGLFVGISDRGISARSARQHKLKQRGIPVTGHDGYFPDIDFSVDCEPHSRWVVKTDISLLLSTPEWQIVPTDWKAEAVEIASRKLTLSDATTDEIRVVLLEVFALESLGCRMLTNYTTGLHVHVGNSDRWIPLETAKKVFQLGTAFSPTIDKLHDYTRIDPDDSYLRYHFPPGYFHKNNGRLRPGANVFDWLASIESVSSYQELGSLFVVPRGDKYTNGHNSAYNFDNLIISDGREEWTRTKTIEFRQHIGTLDYTTVIAWVALTTQIVTFCHNATDTDFLSLLMQGLDPSISVRDFCCGIGLADVFTRHYTGEADLPQSLAMLSIYSKSPQSRDIFDRLDETNDDEASESTDPGRIEQVLQQKLARGLYGRNPNLNAPGCSVRALDLFHDLVWPSSDTVEVAETAAQSASRVRWDLLTFLSVLYTAQVEELEKGQSNVVCEAEDTMQIESWEGYGDM